MALIELKGISYAYPNGNQVLKELNLCLEEGDRIGLSGPNGTGKTTLFHIIMGLRRPDKGEVSIFGKKRNTEQDFKKIRCAVGLLFQDSDDQLFCPSVLEDVAFGPLNMGMTHEEAMERAEETLEDLGITHLKHRVPYQLSGGEKRLVSMATILSMRPDILLMDEPTAGLDEEARDRFISVLHIYPAKAWIMISHVSAILESVSNKHYRLKEGKIHLG